MSFNKWKDEYGLEFEPNYSKETELDCKAAFEAGQQSKQSKQAEIEELQKNFNNALKTIDIQQQFLDDTDGAIKIITSQVDEMKKRIDDLKSFCIKGVESNMLSIEYNQALIDMYKILKGEEN